MNPISEEFVIPPTEEQCLHDGLAGFAWLMIDETGTMIRASEKAEKLFGYESRKYFEGKKIELLLKADFHQTHVGLREEYMLSGAGRSMNKGRVVEGVKRDGSPISVIVTLSGWYCNRRMYATAMISECE